MIEISGISYHYGKKRVLDQVSFQIKKGECTAIVGKNGCGKSTLLSILGGARKPAAGTLLFDGKNPFHNRRLFREMVGYIPQENPLIPELSVKDNLRLWYGGKKRLEDAMQGELLELLHLKELLEMPVSKLSGGMKKRVSIGCAVAYNPSILVLDEPSAALDLVCKEEMKEYLTACRKAGTTILLATHEEKELELCSRILVLKEGKAGEADQAFRGRQLTALF